MREQIKYQKVQREFVERGLASRDRARECGVYKSRDEVMNSLRSIRDQALIRNRLQLEP